MTVYKDTHLLVIFKLHADVIYDRTKDARGYRSLYTLLQKHLLPVENLVFPFFSSRLNSHVSVCVVEDVFISLITVSVVTTQGLFRVCDPAKGQFKLSRSSALYSCFPLANWHSDIAHSFSHTQTRTFYAPP